MFALATAVSVQAPGASKPLNRRSQHLGIDQLAEARRSAIRRMRREDVDAVVTPAVMTRELGNRHELDMRDAQLDQVIEQRDGALEGPLPAERTDVHFVNDCVAQCGLPERAVLVRRSLNPT